MDNTTSYINEIQENIKSYTSLMNSLKEQRNEVSEKIAALSKVLDDLDAILNNTSVPQVEAVSSSSDEEASTPSRSEKVEEVDTEEVVVKEDKPAPVRKSTSRRNVKKVEEPVEIEEPTVEETIEEEIETSVPEEIVDDINDSDITNNDNDDNEELLLDDSGENEDEEFDDIDDVPF